MELTLTGASTLSDRPVAASTSTQSHDHDHGHSHNHNHQKGTCCGPKPKAMDESVLLPTPEQVARFKSDKSFRLNVLSNVVRGGTYEIFINLIGVLVSKEGDEKESSIVKDGVVKIEDREGFAIMVNGYGVDGHTIAHWSAKRGDDTRFLKFMILQSISLNGTTLLIDLHLPSRDTVGMYPLHWAVTEGAIPLVSLLLQHLEDRPTPSTRSSSSSSLMISSSSLMEGSNEPLSPSASHSNSGIDARDSSGCTPLLVAAQYGHPDLAAFLIQRGANPNNVDSSRDTALHWAAYKGSVEVCGMLLHLSGVEGQLDSIDAFGQTPLHLAALRGNVETVRFLMEEAAASGSAIEKEVAVGRVGSKLTHKSHQYFPAKLLTIRDKEDKTPLDLAIKRKKLGCELLLLEYHEQYLSPKKGFFARLGQTCKDVFSVRNWKAWMGMGGSELPIGQNPTVPFYWMTAHIMMAGIVYATEFVGLGSKRKYEEDGLLWDRLGLHLFFMVSWFLTWVTLYYTYRTNPGVLDARGVGNSSTTTPSCKLLCFNGGGYPKDKISLEMDSVTKELRNQFDAVIESFSKNFPSEDKRIPLCHTCRIVRPLRSKHCRVARRCVLLFDHHCPFVGTTIGLYNYIYFFLFLVFFVMMAIGFVVAWVIFLSRSKTFPTSICLMGAYLSLYIIPVLMMVVYHTQLVLNNISTNEQLNLRKYRYFWESGRFHNPFDHGIIRNILQRLSPDRSSYELHPVGVESEERQAMLSNVV
ncbi:hypothetical protein ACHAW6_013654 [Cyclotella cf. meneghiniana]